MADTFIPQTDGAGTKIHSFSRVVAGQTVHEEVLAPAVGPIPSSAGSISGGFTSGLYTLAGAGAAVPVYLGNIFLVGPRYGYITRLTVRQVTLTTGAAVVIPIALIRTTGGKGDENGDDVLWQFDNLDGNITTLWSLGGSQALGSVRQLATVGRLTVPLAAAGCPTGANADRWEAGPGRKPIRVGPMQALQLSLYQEVADTGVTGAKVQITAEGFVPISY